MTNTNETTTTTDELDTSDKSKQQAPEPCLDFRDIHQHPPATTAQYTPLPADPCWDAHKVYFNEREKPTRLHGDEFDEVFRHETPQIAFEQRAAEEKKQSDELDPLGWPVVPAAFRTTKNQGATAAVTLSLSYDVEDDEYDDDDGDDDDLNLLRRGSDHDDEAAILMSQTHGAEMVSGVETVYQAGSTVVGYRVPPMTKEARIQQYETTGVDEESSVEAEDDSDGDDDVAPVKYLEQAEPDEEGMELPLQSFASFDTECHAAAMTSVSAESTSAPMAQLVLDDKVMAAIKPKKRSPKKGNKVVPLLRPPPAEKLAAWEKTKAKKP